MGGRPCKEIVDNLALAAAAAFRFSLTLEGHHAAAAEPYLGDDLATVVNKSLCLGPTIVLASSEGISVTQEMADKVSAAAGGFIAAVKVGPATIHKATAAYVEVVDYVLAEVGYPPAPP